MAKIITSKETSSSVFKIEKDVPHTTWIERKYPFSQMIVGDSFFIETPTIKELRRIRSSACVYGTRVGWKFSIRKEVKKPGSYRCWRIS